MSNFKNSLLKFLKYFDGFGETHTFRINTEKTYNSPIGGFFCLIFLIYTIYYVIFTFMQFMRGEFKTKEYDLKIVSNPIVKMSDHKYFSIAFCLRKQNYLVDDYGMTNLNSSLFYSQSVLNKDKFLVNTQE